MTTRKINKKRPTNSKRTPPPNHATLLFALLVGAALLSLGVGLDYRIVQTQKRLEAAQSELHKVSEEAIQANVRNAESLEAALNLRKELDGARQSSRRAEADVVAAKKQVASLKSDLDQINANRDLLQAELKLAHSEVTQLRARLYTAESQVIEMRLRLKAVQSGLEASKHAAVQAKTELEEQAIQLQSELEMGKAERDELRNELNTAQVSLESPLSKRCYTRLSIDSEARDYLIRTIVFEGEGETEVAKAAIAHVILNRQMIGRWGDNIKDVVMHPWQFEPWMTRRGEIHKLSSKDPRYQDAAEIVDSVLTGRIPDPTAGATYFLNPVVVRQRRGGSLPLWADGEGRPIGRHVFYLPHDAPQRAGSQPPQPDKFQYRPSRFIGAG